MFYLICRDGLQREKILGAMKKGGILAVFHYLSLHSSLYFKPFHDGRELPYSDLYSECLIRLPLYYELTSENQVKIVKLLEEALIEFDA
jgi:dTDP-4-amino-4,6-dideoxygalactose transaminase